MSQRDHRPNILFLLVDALWFNRLAISGYSPSVAPFLDKLIERSVVATRCFATGCPSQFAFPSIFTSRLPLDDNGYGFGISGRGTSFVELLRDAGYATGGFVSAGYGARIYGYDRGFDRFHELFDVSLLVRILRDYHIGYYARLITDGTITRSVFYDRHRETLDRMFAALIRFCRDKSDEISSGALPLSPIIHSWDFAAIIRLVESEQASFRSSPIAYMDNLILTWEKHPLFGVIGSGRTSPQASSGAYVASALTGWIRRNAKQPFFAWAHLMDVHDSNYVTHDLIEPRDDLVRAVTRMQDAHVRILSAGADYKSDRGHDCGLAYVDEQLIRICNFLGRGKLLESTLIVIASDHGCRTAGQPRPNWKEITAFFDQLYHVPFILFHPHLAPKRFDALTSTMDIAPTLLDLVGLPRPSGYRGLPLDAPAVPLRNHLIMEHVGRGPCDLSLKPLEICVRTRTDKGVFQGVAGDPHAPLALREFYRIASDPDERTNLSSDPQIAPEARAMREIADNRAREILSQPQGAASRGDQSW